MEDQESNTEVAEFDRQMMERALAQARLASEVGEVPVGAVLVDALGAVLSEAGNNCIAAADPAGHAEMRAVRQAAARLNNYRLPGTTLYVTLEPCPMCAALLVHARIARVVFGAFDPKGGAIVSKYRIGSDGLLNHTLTITGGVMADQCGQLLREFFRARR
jgi:tRNA(adenine34) deaminase